jgi:hypothetical protein
VQPCARPPRFVLVWRVVSEMYSGACKWPRRPWLAMRAKLTGPRSRSGASFVAEPGAEPNEVTNRAANSGVPGGPPGPLGLTLP